VTETANRGGRPAPTRRLVAAAVLVVSTVFGLLGAAPADARTDDKAKAVLFVHGYNPTSSSTNCAADFDQMIGQLRAEGFTGSMVRVGFYSGDYNCDVNLRSYGSFGDSSSWKSIAKAFSHYIYSQYTSRGVAVDVVGYSMGGLISRGAVWGSQKAESGFSAPIDVEDVITLGTPHNGAAWYSNLCLWGQCASLKPGATDIRWLNQNGNPQGRNGTEFSTLGSDGDWVVPTSSALYMSIPSSNKVAYCCTPHTGSSNYMHSSGIISRSGNGLAYGGQ